MFVFKLNKYQIIMSNAEIQNVHFRFIHLRRVIMS